MKVSELEGGALEWWALQATGRIDDLAGIEYSEFINYFSEDPWAGMMLNWGATGEIIEREKIGINPDRHDFWHAECVHPALPNGVQRSFGTGPTAIIAALRCLIASKYGAEVPDDGRAT